MKRTRLYNIWCNIKSRCYNKNNKDYVDYGNRGIKLCPEWVNSFIAFYDWSISHGYSDNLTIDRIDNNKGYSPDNCRWVDMKTQNNNTRHNHLLTFNGETHTMKEWAEIINVPYTTLASRINILHWDIKRALSIKAE